MKTVSQVLETISFYDFEGSLEDTIKKLKSIQDRYKDKNLKIEYGYSRYDDDREFHLIWERPENEEEKAKRLKEEEQRKEYRKQQYEQLKKEFENNK